MRMIRTCAVAFAFLVTTSATAVAQRYVNDDPCTDLVPPLCSATWQEYGYDNYQDCYEANVGNCEAQQGAGGTYDRQIISAPRCTTPSGINVC